MWKKILIILVVLLAVVIQYGRYSIQNLNPIEGGFLILDAKPPHLNGIKHGLFIGGTGGIGKQLALSFIKRGIKVTIVGRNKPKDKEFDNQNVNFLSADLTLMKNAKDLVEKLKNQNFDVIFFTTGTTHFHLDHTQEGIEGDLAISYLSRQVIVDGLIDNGLDKVKLDSGKKPRIFLMGGPGISADPVLEDINWEDPEKFRSLPRHINTHIFNEALVHYYTVKYPTIEFYGLNPGIIVTSGVEKLIGNGYVLKILTPIVNYLFQSVEDYSENVLVPLMATDKIKPGSVFNQLGNQVEPNNWFKGDENRPKLLITMNHDLLRRKNLL